jgi:hypothetical protein
MSLGFNEINVQGIWYTSKYQTDNVTSMPCLSFVSYHTYQSSIVSPSGTLYVAGLAIYTTVNRSIPSHSQPFLNTVKDKQNLSFCLQRAHRTIFGFLPFVSFPLKRPRIWAIFPFLAMSRLVEWWNSQEDEK